MSKRTLFFKFVFTFILLLSLQNGKAQVVANFWTSDTIGCFPHSVQFHDSSSSNVVYRHWIFGNGNSSIGNAVSPSAIYTTAGVYSVTLIVSDGVDTASITKTNYIHSLAKPTASFTYQSTITGCSPFGFQVYDNSFSATAPISAWEWDFDDGTPLMFAQSPQHTYINSGVFNVVLKVTDTNGCSNTTVQTNLVTVYPQPMANFSSAVPVSSCTSPLPINLSNTSTGTPPMSYAWTITDPLGAVSTYNSTTVQDTGWDNGGYDVQLIATNNLGCTDTLLVPDYLWIGTIQSSINAPDTSCQNTLVDFYENSNGGNTFSWDFGDGTTGNGPHVTHAYTSTGTFTVTLISFVSPGCSDTAYKDIYIENVQADFTSSPHFGCSIPLMVNFTDQSQGTVVSWEWRFGTVPGMPSQISNLQNPTYYYSIPGIYDDTLTITTASGCTSTKIVPANEELFVLEAIYIPDVVQGCAPLLVNFQNTTLPFDSIDYVEWNYMDGSPIDTTFSPSHTFTTPGIYSVTLTVYSVSGCSDSYDVEINVGQPQNANFTIDTNMACASQQVGFTNISSDTNLITNYLWFFSDSTTSDQFEPEHYFLDTGYISISLVVYYNGCPDTLTVDSAIYINGPLISYKPTLDCDTPNHYFFNPSTKGGTEFLWDLGDGTLDSVNLQLDHYYPPVDGNYTASLYAYDSVTNCSFTKEAKIKVRYLVGVVQANDTNACLNQVVKFDTYSSTNAISNVHWALDDTTLFNLGISDISVTMPSTGDHYMYAVVSDVNGCTDTLSQLVRVWSPQANFGSIQNTGCAPLTVQFVDSSISDTNIVAWQWNFFNGQTSTLQNPVSVFNGKGTTYYNVSLMVTDTFGCTNKLTLSNYVLVIEPPSFFTATKRLICDGDSVYFSGAPQGNYTYLWDFGDGTFSNAFQTPHSYSTGSYTVSLTVTDSNGCDSTYVRSNYIKVQSYPIANFTANPLETFCYPSSITFFDSSIAQNIAYWSWNFGDSPNWITSQNSSVQNLYTSPGLFDVTMAVTTTYGCSDTITKPSYIDIGGPTASIIAQPVIGCVHELVQFDVDNTNASAEIFIWDFGDGTLDTSSISNSAVMHTYSAPGNYAVTLLYSDSLGLCQKTDELIFNIHEVISNFNPSREEGCQPLNVTNLNQSTGATSYKWYLNNALISSTVNSSIQITTPGWNQIMLISTDDNSTCSDTVVHPIYVFPKPDVVASPNQVVCIGDSIELLVSGAQNYEWSPATYLNYTTIPNPTSWPTNDISYVVKGTDTNGCSGKDTVDVTVQQIPELLVFPQDTFIFTGSYYPIETQTTLPVIYKWSPDLFLNCSDCPNPIATPTGPTWFELVYTDPSGCFTQDTAFFIDVEDDFSVYIPNAFTPNGDGRNDTFGPVTFGVKELVFMRIYNRWGELVFETSDLDLGWDGTLNGEIAAHNTIFTYQIQVKRYNNEIKDYVGMVVLISK